MSKKVVQENDRIRPEKSEVLELICNNTRAKQRLGWSPKYALDQGLDETIDYVRKHTASYKTGKYVV